MDLDILNATVFDGYDVLSANRVSIRDGRIAEIGTGQAAGPAAHSIDAHGRLLTPGFIDAHVHTTFGGQESLACDLSGVEGLQNTLGAIAAYLATDHTGAGEDAMAQPHWLTGGGWTMSDFPGGAPTAALLDDLGSGDTVPANDTGPGNAGEPRRAATERPIILISRDHHSAWVNSAAMAIAGLNKDTPTPAGGVIEKDADGNPTGCLHESAMDIVSSHVPPATDAEVAAGLAAGRSYLHRLGVTAWMDAIVGDYSGHRDPSQAYIDAEDNGELHAEVVGSLWWPRDVTTIADQVAAFVERRRDDPDSSYRTNSVKFMLDGIVESRTAAMSHEYSCTCGGFGTSYFERDHLHAAFAALDAAGFDIHCHAVGDGAVKAALDAFAAIDNRRDDARHHIAHVQVVDPIDIPRFAELGIAANLQALWASRDQQLIDLNLPILGEERTGWLYPFRGFADAGTSLAMGSDWPVSTADPWEAIHVAVNRSHPHDGDPEPLLPEQAIPLLTALRAYTSGSAHLLRSTRNGRIRLGAEANLALASTNPFVEDPSSLVTVRNLLTIAAGRIVHDATTSPDAEAAVTTDTTAAERQS